MVSRVIILLAVVVFSACSTPKYAYYFDHHNYNLVKKQASSEVSPLDFSSHGTEDGIASEPAVFAKSNEGLVAAPAKTYVQMSKNERTALRYHLKRELKSFVSKKNDGTHEAMSTGWDSDLKLATIFGAVGVTGMIIGGSVFNVIGWISFVIGLVFFVKWVIRQ